MRCPNCGGEIPSNLKFCTKCGAKIPEGRVCGGCGAAVPPHVRFCTKCGEAVPGRQVCLFCGQEFKSGVKFCSACGKPANAAPRPATPPVAAKPAQGKAGPEKPFYKDKRFLLIAAVSCVAFVIVLIAVFASPAGGGIVTGKLNTGAPVQVAEGAVGPEGGALVVESGQLEGMTISVPEGAYEGQTSFTVSESEIKSYTFGDLFNPATPLITVENGGGFAAEPMTVTVPVEIGEGEIAAAFYYDEETGRLEGIPCVAQDSGSITLMTSHFSCFVITKETIEKLDNLVRNKPLETGFKPGQDDFYAVNYGSWACEGGHCAGQSIAEIYFYNTFGRTGRHLREEPIVDNDRYEATEGLYWDDNLGIRLSSLLQTFYEADVDTTYDEMRDVNEDLTYYYFLYTMALNKEPQLMNIWTADYSGGHAVVAYQISRNAIWVADPNYPGDTGRKIDVTHWLNPEKGRETAELGVYETKPRADGKTQKYSWIAYYGIYALVDYQIVDGNWNAVLEGRDAAASIFKPLPVYIAYTGADDQGVPYAVDLSPDTELRVGRQDLAKINPQINTDGNVLFIQMKDQHAFGSWGFYLGDQKVKPEDIVQYTDQAGDWWGIKLKPGANDIGILYMREKIYQKGKKTEISSEFDSFQRFTVILDGESATVAATESPQAEEGFEGSWQIYTSELLRVQGSETTMNYVNSLFSQYGGTRALGSDRSFASLDDYIAAQNEGYVREPIEFEKRNLVISRNADGTYSAEINGYITYGTGPNAEKRAYTKTFELVEVSGNTITFQIPYDAVEFTGREGYELTLSGDTLTGFKYLPFMHPYASNDDQLSATGGDGSSTIMGPDITIETTSNGTPEGYDPEEVWSFEAVRTG